MKTKRLLFLCIILMFASCSKKVQRLTPNSEQNTLTELYKNESQPKKKLALEYLIESKQKINSQQYSQAELKLLKALEINEYRQFTDYFLAQTFYKLGRYEESMDYVNKVEGHFSSYPNYRYLLLRLKADNLVKIHKSNEALKTYKMCLKMHSNDEYVKEKINELKN